MKVNFKIPVKMKINLILLSIVPISVGIDNIQINIYGNNIYMGSNRHDSPTDFSRNNTNSTSCFY